MGMFDDLIPGDKVSSQSLGDLVAPKGKLLRPPPSEMTGTEEVLSKIQIPTWMQELASTARSFAQGAADPVIGTAQLAANVVGMGDPANKAINEYEARQKDMKFNPESGAHTAARIAGNIASPANMVGATQVARMAPAVTAAQRAKQGIALGAIGAASQPVVDAESYWGQKAGDVGIGAVAGGVLNPVIGKVADVVTRKLINAPPSQASTLATAEREIESSLAEMGIRSADLPADDLNALRQQVMSSLDAGNAPDAGTLLRQSDFDALGMKSLQGQVTRDPMQFAREQNLRGVADVGQPLTDRLLEQGNILQDRIVRRASGAADPYQAGGQISGALAKTDELLSGEVSARYQQARTAAGKDLDVPLTGLAQDYAQTLSDFADRIPTSVRQKFTDLGLDPANPTNQRKLFTVEDADKLLKTINKNQSNDPAVNAALGELRTAVKRAVSDAAPDGGVFAPAVSAARERFQMHDAIPALKAASEGSIAPEDFVRKFVTGGKIDDVKGLASVLKQADPDAFQQARAQIAETLRNSAYGSSMVGKNDAMAAKSYADMVKKISTEKLKLFFGPDEVADILREARVATYITRAPNTSTVNRSNTAAAGMNLLRSAPFVGKTIGGVADRRAVNSSLKAALPVTKAPLSPEQQNNLAALLGMTGLGAGM